MIHADLCIHSLSGTLLRLRLSGALTKTAHFLANEITDNVVYSHPTVNALTALVCGEEADRVTIEDLIKKYSVALDPSVLRPSCDNVPIPEEQVVLVTGTTGNLGAEILLRLLEDKRVKRVYALNRKSSHTSSQQRHEERFKDRAFDTNLLSSSKVVYLEGEASERMLGLNTEAYEEVSID